jgi:endonuclease YncB( thermonuclease family)
MDLITKLSSGFLAGLSVGTTCLGLCLPIFLPILLSQKRTAKKSFFLVMEFSLGRLIGYLFFGLIFGFLGQMITSNFIHYIVSLATLWLGILMIVYSMGVIDKKFCAALPFAQIKWPFLLGFLTGVNICPPFLASLTYVFNLKDAIASLIFFLMFFLGTSVYIVPTAFLGVFTKINWLPKLARVSGVIVGLYFILNTLIVSGLLPKKTPSVLPQSQLSPTAMPTTQLSPTKVIRVIDGDTIVLQNGKTVRYIGIDTPEIKSKNSACYAQEAKSANERLVLDKMVRLEKDVSETDKYQRLLRYVYVGSVFVNEYLVKEGYALLATYPPDVKYQSLFQKAQDYARENNKGLWNENACK